MQPNAGSCRNLLADAAEGVLFQSTVIRNRMTRILSRTCRRISDQVSQAYHRSLHCWASIDNHPRPAHYTAQPNTHTEDNDRPLAVQGDIVRRVEIDHDNHLGIPAYDLAGRPTRTDPKGTRTNRGLRPAARPRLPRTGAARRLTREGGGTGWDD